jgi:hypothetical protein
VSSEFPTQNDDFFQCHVNMTGSDILSDSLRHPPSSMGSDEAPANLGPLVNV